jgi:hypothetical protein
MTALFLWLVLLFLVRHQPVNALLSTAFLAFHVWLLVMTARLRPSSWSSGPPSDRP